MTRSAAYLFTLIVLLLIIPFAKAQNGAEIMPIMEEVPDEAIEEPCVIMQKQLAEKSDYYAQLQIENELELNIFTSKISSFSKKTKLMGYDTTVLDQNLAQFNRLLAQYTANSVSLLKSMAQAENTACVGSQTLVNTSIIAVDSNLEKVRKSISDMSILYKETLKSDISEIANPIIEVEKGENEVDGNQ